MNSVDTSVKKRRSSWPILAGVVVVAVGVYFGLPKAMTYMMVLEEQAKAKAKYEESLIPNTSTEIEPTSGVKKMPLGASAGGGGPRAGGPGAGAPGPGGPGASDPNAEKPAVEAAPAAAASEPK